MTSPPFRKGAYYNIEGVKYPSVTTILRVINKPALITWLQKRAAEKALEDPAVYDTPQKVMAALELDRDSAGQRGSTAHAVAHEYVRFLKKEITEDDLRPYQDDPYYPAIVSFFETLKPEIIASELTVFNREHVYAGTLDLLATMQDGKRYVVDWKTAKAVWPEYSLQIEAYRQCDGAIVPGDPSTLEKWDGPLAEAGAVVLLKPNGTFQFHKVPADFEVFLAALALYRWQSNDY